MNRKPLSKKLRFEVFKRDRFTCTYCGRRPPDIVLEVDHILAVARGGSDTIDNLTSACDQCNRGKGARDLGDTAPAIDRLQLMANIQEMMERQRRLKHQVAVYDEMDKAEDQAIEAVEDMWLRAFHDGTGFQEASVRTFVRRLDLSLIREAVDSTLRTNESRGGRWEHWQRWKYFCGTCWKMIRGEPA